MKRPPRYAPDLFSPEALADPYPHYRRIHDLAAVVRLSRPRIRVIARHADVRAALLAPDVLTSARGISLNALANWSQRRGGGALTSEGEAHHLARKRLKSFLMPRMVRALRPALEALAAERVERLLGTGPFDAVHELASLLPLEVATRLAGVPADQRGGLPIWTEAAMSAAGPAGRRVLMSLSACRAGRRAMARIGPGTAQPGSWAASLFEAARRGEISESEARSSAIALIGPGLGTTTAAISNLLLLLARHGEIWQKLAANRSLVPGAVSEAMRLGTPIRCFTRVALEDYVAGEVEIPRGARVGLLYGAANRDERAYPDPDRFDVTRNPADQLGWGAGRHVCVGMHLARLEMEILLDTLITRAERIELAGSPIPSGNSMLHGLRSLPLILR